MNESAMVWKVIAVDASDRTVIYVGDISELLTWFSVDGPWFARIHLRTVNIPRRRQ